MTLVRNEIIRLLQIAGSYDGRKASEASIHAWADAATRARWTYDEAAEAVKDYYTNCGVWVMPVHITERVREARQDRAMREAIIPPDPDGQRRVAQLISGVFPPMPDDRDDFLSEVLSRGCPACGAQPGEPCTRESPEGRVAIRFPHLPRMRPHRDVS